MSLMVLVPLSLGMGAVGLGAFFWALRSDQFDDPKGAAWRVIPPEAHAEETLGSKEKHMENWLPTLIAATPGEGAVATGRLEGGTFRATEILAKHDEDYMPRELAGMMADAE